MWPGSVHTVPRLTAAKRAIKKAFQLQIERKGFSLVEVLSTCPTNWGLSPVEALHWVERTMIPIFPLGVYKVSKEALDHGEERIIVAGFGGRES